MQIYLRVFLNVCKLVLIWVHIAGCNFVVSEVSQKHTFTFISLNKPSVTTLQSICLTFPKGIDLLLFILGISRCKTKTISNLQGNETINGDRFDCSIEM